MGYELTDILRRCTRDDVKLLINTIDSYSFTDDKGLRELCQAWKSGSVPIELAHKLETEIRYLGSSDVAYLGRKLKGQVPAGVPVEEMIEDVCKAVKVSYKKVSSLEHKLEMLAKALVEKTILEKSPEEQIKLLKEMNISEEKMKLIQTQLKKSTAQLIPILVGVIGKKATMEIVQTIIVAIMSQFLEKQAAQLLLKTVMTKMPWLAFLGPLVMGAMISWTALDLCGPAMRKTIPLMLHLGLIALRDGAEDEAFWE